jgi:hypothetical protein
MNGGTIRKASVEISSLIEDVIKPCPGGNDALCALHELDILDKHRLLIPMINATSLIGVHVYDDKGPVISGGLWVITGTRSDGGFIPVEHTGNLHIKDKGKVAFQIYFDTGMPYEGQMILQTLLDFKKLVDGIIDTFEAVYVPKS